MHTSRWRYRLFGCCSPRLVVAAAVLLSILFSLLTTAPTAHAGDRGPVFADFVPDGDTIILVSGETVRLSAVNCPEIGRDGAADEYGAREARAFTRRLVEGAPLTLHRSVPARDRYGRTLARVWLPGGRFLDRVLLEAGWAYVYPHPEHGDALLRELTALQRQAMDAGRGFWPRVLAAGDGKTYAGNLRSKRFHDVSCRGAKRMSPENRVCFPSLEAAFGEGYAPHKGCVRWPR